MLKADLVEAVAKRFELPRARAQSLVDDLFGADGAIAEELARGGTVQISGFGSFETRERAPRRGRDPKTGAPIALAGSTVAAFRPGAALRDAVARGARDRRGPRDRPER